MQQSMCAPNMSKDDTAFLFTLRSRKACGFGEMYPSKRCPICTQHDHKDTIPELVCEALLNVDGNGSKKDILSPPPDNHVYNIVDKIGKKFSA